MIISPFTPLFFNVRRSYGIPSPFTQFFAVGDRLNIQAIRTSSEEETACYIKQLESAAPAVHIFPVSHTMGDGSVVDCFTPILGGIKGLYTVTVGGQESEPFEVTSDETAIERSVLIEYSPSGNGIRNDVVAEIEGERQWFSFRIPGGFKASAYDFSVDNEQFTAQTADIVELYSRESMQETLTVGWSRGVPIWFGQLLNRLLTCKYVYLDGLRYARYQSSVPEKTQTMDDVNSFVFKQKLQRINHLDPTKPS